MALDCANGPWLRAHDLQLRGRDPRISSLDPSTCGTRPKVISTRRKRRSHATSWERGRKPAPCLPPISHSETRESDRQAESRQNYMRYRARACRSRFIDASHRSVAITESNSARRLRGPHLGLPIGNAALAGFLTRKAEMRGMCGGQPLLIKYIVNILIPYPNYGFWQRAADPSNPSDLPRAPRPTPVGARPLETRLRVLSMCFRTSRSPCCAPR
jgi:hypothetical protein